MKIWKLLQRDGLTYTAKRSLAYLIAHTPLAYRLSFSYAAGTRLVFAPALLTYNLFANRQSRTGVLTLLTTYVPDNGTVLDVGGNIGSFGILAAHHVGPNGTVRIFEPAPKFAHIIETNLKKNHFSDRATVFPYALGENKATVYLEESVADDTTNYIAQSGTQVQQLPLDDFTTELDTIDLLKIDVEGYEHHVLRGAANTLAKTKHILIEFIPLHLKRAGTNPYDVITLLEKYFDLFTQAADGGLTPFTYQEGIDRYPDLIGHNRSYVQKS